MGRAHCDVTDATDQLATLARATNRTLGEVAQSILGEHAKPDGTRITYAWPRAMSADPLPGPHRLPGNERPRFEQPARA
jgi:hypothetical protein